MVGHRDVPMYVWTWFVANFTRRITVVPGTRVEIGQKIAPDPSRSYIFSDILIARLSTPYPVLRVSDNYLVTTPYSVIVPSMTHGAANHDTQIGFEFLESPPYGTHHVNSKPARNESSAITSPMLAPRVKLSKKAMSTPWKAQSSAAAASPGTRSGDASSPVPPYKPNASVAPRRGGHATRLPVVLPVH